MLKRQFRDALRVLRAVATNQVARVAPAHYLRLTRQTGRGSPAAESPLQVAEYFERCFLDYFDQLGVPKASIGEYLTGKTVLEYGPGDMPAVALLMRAHGARSVYCVDRFPMLALTSRSRAVLSLLRERLPGPEGSAFDASFIAPGDMGSGLRTDCLEYLVTQSGLSGLRSAVDLVVSRAVLEHVNDLPATLADMCAALRPGGRAVHLVDLRSHGLHQQHRLDFLTWSPAIWHLMYSHKGVPNRWRVDRYRELLTGSGLSVKKLQPTAVATIEEVDQVRPHLAQRFRNLRTEDLTWLGFWLVCGKPT
jgi:SAM-dependent methyltransferase